MPGQEISSKAEPCGGAGPAQEEGLDDDDDNDTLV